MESTITDHINKIFRDTPAWDSSHPLFDERYSSQVWKIRDLEDDLANVLEQIAKDATVEAEKVRDRYTTSDWITSRALRAVELRTELKTRYELVRSIIVAALEADLAEGS